MGQHVLKKAKASLALSNLTLQDLRHLSKRCFLNETNNIDKLKVEVWTDGKHILSE